ncbi:MAG TPA: 23S rRNA (guanosine(2251)-2'-O)-methyltransferase RlmB [Mycobacteriales bacterium]|jgi:23S rRNA (guanosine2251-2'-O)-methyltransferase|nr:23S rRNA (guanosine(2251)-2'-O)-methyltransferase RlmB [Mycobacteriales bacterium]
MSVKGGGQGGRGNKPGSHRKGAAVGSGGQAKRRLEGKGPTPPAEARKGHPAARRAAAAAKKAAAPGAKGKPAPTRTRGPAPAKARGSKPSPDTPETVIGRNPVVEALRAKVPATALYVAHGVDNDERMVEALAVAGKAGIPILEMSRAQLDKMTGGMMHQGLALQVPPYAYLHPDDLLARALEAPAPLVVALDGVTDPRNLGAVVRSAAAFGAQGVLLPERRSAGMTAAAWRTSAGAAARLPVARCTNLARTLTAYKEAGLFVVGLAAGGTVSLDDLEVATSPLVVVVGSEGDGLGRLVEETCDLTVSIPMSGLTESLNAGIAAAVTLAEVARRRRSG